MVDKPEFNPRSFAVIGAGVTGLTTAYELLSQGYEVTVFDRHRYAAMETSYANGGQLSASNAEVWTQWSTVLKGLKWMLQADAPLLVNPAPTLHKMRWMAEFLSNIPNYRANTVETVRLAIAARAVLFETAEREGIDFDLERRGILHFYDRRKDLAHARKVNELLRAGGLERREVSAEEIREIEAMGVTKIFSPEDGRLLGFEGMIDEVPVESVVQFCRELRDILDYAGADKVLFVTDNPAAPIADSVADLCEPLMSSVAVAFE